MTHCKDCKWWAKDYVQQHFGGFDLIDWGKCGLADDRDDPVGYKTGGERETEFIYAFAGEHYQFAFVQTRANFGCNQFAKKERELVSRAQADGGDYEAET